MPSQTTSRRPPTSTSTRSDITRLLSATAGDMLADLERRWYAALADAEVYRLTMSAALEQLRREQLAHRVTRRQLRRARQAVSA